MRLAFSVAAHLEPEILVVDEVLAVGDAAFQKKCLGKMNDVASGGRTVLFVSHNMAAVQALCRTCVWLDQGQIAEIGRTGEVVQHYLQSAVNSGRESLADRKDRGGDGSVRVTSIRIEDDSGRRAIFSSSPLRITVEYKSDGPVMHPRIYLSVYDLNHSGIWVLDSECVGGVPDVLPCSGSLVCTTAPIRLTPGRCFVNVGFHKGTMLADHVEYAAHFDVEGDNFFPSGRLPDRAWVISVLEHAWTAQVSES
jgi:lipopolysaccharide transport system ATP-binding protein